MSTGNPGLSVVLYGPQGCGKSTNAKRISKALNLPRIVEFDEICHDKRMQHDLPAFGVLVITIAPEKVGATFPRLSYDHAMTAVKISESVQGASA